MAAAKLCPADGFTIAADTVVAAGRRIIPKAETVAQAEKCLELLPAAGTASSPALPSAP